MIVVIIKMLFEYNMFIITPLIIIINVLVQLLSRLHYLQNHFLLTLKNRDLNYLSVESLILRFDRIHFSHFFVFGG